MATKPPKSTNIVGYEDFTKIFGIVHSTLNTFVEEGMPVYSEHPRKFDTVECLSWLINREISKKLGPRLDPAQEVAKLNQTKNEILKLELSEKNKELIKSDSVIRLWSDILTSLRIKLLTIPKSFSQLFNGIQDEYVAEAELEKIIRDVLKGLSDV